MAAAHSSTALVYLNVEMYKLWDDENNQKMWGQHDALRADVLDHRKTDAAELRGKVPRTSDTAHVKTSS